MIPHQTKVNKLPRMRYGEVKKRALILFNQIKKRTKRKPFKENKRSGRKYFMSCFPQK